MERTDNYKIQAQQARERFLTYDQEALIRKLKLAFDEDFLYAPFFGQRHRLCRKTGSLERLDGDTWVDANSFSEVMTFLDLLCDSREDRFLQGRWKNMTDFGLMFHRGLMEPVRDPWADLFEARQEDFRRACQVLGGRPLPIGNIACAIEVFDGLELALQLWFGDEEFPAGLRYLWDGNALMYLKYETMHFARGLLLQRLKEIMES